MKASMSSDSVPGTDSDRKTARGRGLGSLWMLVAGFLFACMGVFAKLGLDYFSAAELMFYRSLFGVVVIFVIIRFNGLSLGSRHWKMHLSRSLVGFAGAMLFFVTIGLLPLATATTLNYTSPLFMTLLAIVVFRERPHFLLLGTIAFGFAGVVLLLQPTFSTSQSIAGLLGLASGLFGGIAGLTTRQLGRLGEPSWRVVFYFLLVCMAGAGIWSGIDGFHAIGVQHSALLLGMGACGTLGQLAMTRAYRVGHTLTVGSFAYSTVVFTSLFSMLIWSEMLSAESWLAIALIVASGVSSARMTTRT